jgi:hypothetical protein
VIATPSVDRSPLQYSVKVYEGGGGLLNRTAQPVGASAVAGLGGCIAGSVLIGFPRQPPPSSHMGFYRPVAGFSRTWPQASGHMGGEGTPRQTGRVTSLAWWSHIAPLKATADAGAAGSEELRRLSFARD